jgi:hypothetical protein
MKQITILLIVLSMLTACATQTTKLGDPGYKKSYSYSYSKDDSFFLGFGPSTEVNAALVCKGADNVRKVESSQTALDTLLMYITLGLYTPRNVTVYCK